MPEPVEAVLPISGGDQSEIESISIPEVDDDDVSVDEVASMYRSMMTNDELESNFLWK